jgi:hypothetical protein
VGIMLTSLEGEEFQHATKLDFITKNNEAKYEAC